MASKTGSLFELIVLPCMVVLPVTALVLLQKRIVKAETAATAVQPAAPAIHPWTAFNGFPYLELPQDKIRSANAVKELTQVIAQKEQALGRNDPEMFILRNNLANALLAEGRYVEAEQSQRELLKDMAQSLPELHPDTFRCRFNLALNLRMQRKIPEARKEMENVYQAWREVLGEGHPRTQQALLVLETLNTPH